MKEQVIIVRQYFESLPVHFVNPFVLISFLTTKHKPKKSIIFHKYPSLPTYFASFFTPIKAPVIRTQFNPRLYRFLIYLRRVNKTMMTNNTFQNRYNPMSTSSMIAPNPEFKRINPFNQHNNAFDPFQKNHDHKQQQSPIQSFPRAMASQSMISTNPNPSSKRTTFGKLDSMARNVTTTFKQQTHQESTPKTDNPFAHDDSTTHSMISTYSGTNKHFYGFSKMNEQRHMATEPAEPVTKKRRESIDLGFTGRSEISSQMLPFLRKGVQNESRIEKTHSNNEHDLHATGMEAMKQKNFEFLKKRKDFGGSETTGSMIGPSVQGVHSMKNLQQFNLNTIKKPEFMSPTTKQPINDVKCPEDRNKYDNNPKNQQQSSPFHHSPVSPCFQFKKKKAFEVPIQVIAAKPQTKEQIQSKQPLTAKERRNAKPQRQIKLSDFQILDKLGKGAFGDVYMAQQKNIGFICVIKKMSKKRIREMKVENHILREIKIQSYLNQANITALFGYFHDQEHLYLIIEALPDGSLQQVKKKRKLPQKETAAIIKQVSDGLKHMHEESIIHRDLKPQNLFVNDNVIKLGDFGCSIFNQNSGLRTTVVGCLEYSSPEQLSNEGYSQKIDAWGLGILTYELLFGKSPFQKDIINITRHKEAEAKLSQLTFPSCISIKEETKDFIQKLLAEDPDKRMDMDQVLAHPFLREEVNKKLPQLDLI